MGVLGLGATSLGIGIFSVATSTSCRAEVQRRDRKVNAKPTGAVILHLPDLGVPILARVWGHLKSLSVLLDIRLHECRM